MKPVRTVRGRVMPLLRDDVDTDQIMPKQFLTRVERSGYGEFVFDTWRQDPSFVFHDARFRGANILLAGRNFGSGSSREHAVWGLQQYGFDAVIAPSFSDIFIGNCVQSRLVPAVLPEDTCARINAMINSDPSVELVLDLDRQTISYGVAVEAFQIDADSREVLMHGLDDVSLILRHEEELLAYEKRRPAWVPEVVVA
jgi:3-isopropylmalate/(R)-2-methylmalate dehydratase small subunit